MRLIINIPEEQYRTLNAKTQEDVLTAIDSVLLYAAVKNGTPLSESEDCVSRQAAIDAIWDGVNMDIYTREVKECLEALPSVTPAEKVGHWIDAEVLDKIRAEIEQNAYPIVHGVNNHEKGMTLYGILQILDKYKHKAESEK